MPRTTTHPAARRALGVLAGAAALAAAAIPTPPQAIPYASAAHDPAAVAVATTVVQQIPGADMISHSYATSAASAGNLLVLGTPDDGPGAAQVFLADTAGWQPLGTLTAPNPSPGDQFGAAVDVTDSGLILIGAPGAGQAHLFTPTEDGWDHTTTLTAPTTRGLFATAVAIDDMAAAITTTDPDRPGRVDVYRPTSSSLWAWSQTLNRPDLTPHPTPQFGTSVDIHRTTLIAGDPAASVAGTDQAGAAHVYTLTGDAFTHTHTLTAPTPRAGERVGQAVSTTGNQALVGAPGLERAGKERGGAYLFTRGFTTWDPVTIFAVPASTGGGAGQTVDLAGGIAVIGAPDATDTGQGHVFVHTEGRWVLSETVEGPADNLGGAVAAIPGGAVVVDTGP